MTMAKQSIGCTEPSSAKNRDYSFPFAYLLSGFSLLGTSWKMIVLR